MSQMGQSRRFERALATSAVHPGADIRCIALSDATGQEQTDSSSAGAGLRSALGRTKSKDLLCFADTAQIVMT